MGIPPPFVVGYPFSGSTDGGSGWRRLALDLEVPHRVCAMSMTHDTPDFGAVTSFEDGEVTIALRGTAEHGSAFALGAILDAAIDRRPASMVLDVAELESLGATGLLAVFDAEKRLAASGVTLTVRSPSVLVNRLLGIMESAETLRRERSLPRGGHLGPEQVGERGVLSPRFASNLSGEDLRRVTALPADPDVVDGALRLVVALARAPIGWVPKDPSEDFRPRSIRVGAIRTANCVE